MTTIPCTVNQQRVELEPTDLIALLDFESRAYNVGYALGFTSQQIDRMPASELTRFMELAKQVVAGERETAEQQQLATHMRIALWAARGEM